MNIDIPTCQWRLGARTNGSCWRKASQVQSWMDGENKKISRVLCQEHYEELITLQNLDRLDAQTKGEGKGGGSSQ